MKRIFVDMDGVLCDYEGAYHRDIAKNPRQVFPQSRFGFFTELEPLSGAIEGFKELQKTYDVWICTRPSVQNLTSYSEKAYWLRKYFGDEILQKTVMTSNKSIVKGDYLIDDQTDWGQTEFEGELLLFGSEKFPDWAHVMEYLREPVGYRWILKYHGDKSYEDILPFLQATGITKVIDHTAFPTLLVAASNEAIGNFQHFESIWRVYPEKTYEIPSTRKKLKKEL